MKLETVSVAPPGPPEVVLITMSANLSWKIMRKMTVVGSTKMAVFDDMEPERKVTVYDKGPLPRTETYGEYIQVRSGDITIPRVPATEPSLAHSSVPCESLPANTSRGPTTRSEAAGTLRTWTVAVNGQTLTTRAIVIAAGGRPIVPAIPGLEKVEVLTSDNVWGLRELPQRLVVLGGGPIGCELAQAFARLGSKVTQVEMLPRIMAKEDPEISEMVAKQFRAEGMDVLVNHKALRVLVEDGEKILVVEHQGAETMRKTSIRRGGEVVKESKLTAIQRA